jgi:undecaprenyl-diphosphatase
MLETIRMYDENLFLFLNSQNNPFLDQIMWFISQLIFWGPLYVWFLWLLYKQFPNHYWTVLLSIVLMITFSDQLCNLAKESFMRLRPTHEPHLQSLVHTVNGYRGGMYSFYSGHSANTFTVAFFLIFSTSGKRLYLILPALIFASFTAYSRIYLGVHYPLDILTGAIMGGLAGTGFALAHKKLRLRYFSKPV